MPNGEAAVYAATLLAIPGVGRRTAVKVMSEFPTLELLLAATDEEREHRLNRAGARLGSGMAQRLDSYSLSARSLVQRHEDAGVQLVAFGDPLFPQGLRVIDDPPAVLFLRGNASALAALSIAVVGTRRATPSGLRVADRVTRRLVSAGYSIVAGLAKGIDAAAHRATLDAGGTTVAVVAEGLDRIYPAEHRDLANQIAISGGALVSEYPIGVRARRASFVDRDRLQSALSIAVIPIQTDIEGGTMHTVRFAERQGRLLACPKPIAGEESLPQWKGIRLLIEQKRAIAFDKDSYDEFLGALSLRRDAHVRAAPLPAVRPGNELAASMSADRSPVQESLFPEATQKPVRRTTGKRSAGPTIQPTNARRKRERRFDRA